MQKEYSPLIFASKISRYYKKNIWLKLENLNKTGSHKDRESICLIEESKKKKFGAIGCASTGNLAISLAFFSKIKNIKCFIWLQKKNLNTDKLYLIKNLGAKVFIKNTRNLKDLYELSTKYMRRNKIFNANPNSSKNKILANTEIIMEIYDINKKVDTFVTCVNNGTHILGLQKGLKKNHLLTGIFTKSSLAPSINTYTKYEFPRLKEFFDIKKRLIKAGDKNIKLGFNLFRKEGINSSGSSAAVIGSLNNKIFKKRKNICCIVTGNPSIDLSSLQKFILRK